MFAFYQYENTNQFDEQYGMISWVFYETRKVLLLIQTPTYFDFEPELKFFKISKP